LAGTDGPGGCLVPGASLHDELENFVRAGFTPAEALRSATLEPARFLGLSDSLGTIKLHKVADLVLLNANPLENIRNARLVAGVVTDGRWVSREEIRKRQRDRIAYALPERAFTSGCMTRGVRYWGGTITP
jgi:imidazolonepropionase-like amidohydrolase